MRGRWFFFYGTLAQEHDNAMTRAIMPLLDGGERATARGQLRAVRTARGWYPVLCAGKGRVVGRLYRANRGFGMRHLRLLDAYEGFDRLRLDASEYVRRKVWIRIGRTRLILADAYGFNRPVHAGLRVVGTGDFAAFVSRNRLRVYEPACRPRPA